MNKIKNVIEKGYKLNDSNIYNVTFDVYKKMVLPASAILFLLIIVFGGLYMVSLFSIFGDPKEIQLFFESLAKLKLKPEIMFYYILATSAINGFASIFGAGFIKMARDVYHNELPKFGTAFTFFTKIDGLKIFIFCFLVQIISNAFSIGLEYIGLQLVSFFIFILIQLLTLFVIPFIIFDKLPILKALSASVAIANQKPFKIMSFIILLGLLSISGVIGFLIGIIFTLPIFYCFNFSIYENIVNKN